MYGVPPTCVYQQDGASSHAAKVAQAFCAAKFPKFLAKGVWPPNSPDLNVLDFFARGHLQAEVDKKKPQPLGSLKVCRPAGCAGHAAGHGAARLPQLW